MSKKYNAVLTPVLLNGALSALKVAGVSSARESVKLTTRALALELSPADQAKALYRRALARIALKEEVDAERDLIEAAALKPDDAGIKHELTKVREQAKAKKEAEKKKFKKMFG